MRAFLVLSPVFAVVAALSLSPSAPAGTVAIGTPVIVWTTTEQMKRSCAAVPPINGCTILREAMLTCECFRSGSVWRRHARVSGVPVVFLSQSTYLVHELSHVADFRALLGEYLRNVESRTFPSAPECDASAGRVRAGFGDELVAVRDESARRRDGMQIADATRSVPAGVVEEEVAGRAEASKKDASLHENLQAADGAVAAVAGVPLAMFVP